MVDDELRLGISEAVGKATASLCVQAALIATLSQKNLLTADEVATLAGIASATLSQLTGVHPDVRTVAEGVLRGFSQSWVKPVTRN
jgi:hypothetical protein